MEKRHGGMGVGQRGSLGVWDLGGCPVVERSSPASGKAGQPLSAVSCDTQSGEK
ncbi:hypothetical protein CLV31_1245 [Algoriphagus aquaeductus]|uniref:Uncharacterized protein n=1 Tax=Algoriphagus aquaeductus TaxID=475299 RepID=A0A326RKL3_9BACT|nr:hypothetical protein CLV31_1245 [Algoriphagus aquaeductus]